MDIVSDITKSYIIFFLLIIVGTSCVALASGYIAEKMVKQPNVKRAINSMTLIQAILMILLTASLCIFLQKLQQKYDNPFLNPALVRFGWCHYCIIVNTSKLS